MKLNKLLLLGLLILTVSITSSCGKYAGEVDWNYIGTWHSDTLTLVSNQEEIYNLIVIDGEENSLYGYQCSVTYPSYGCLTGTSGNATINKKGTKLYIGTRNNMTSLKINEPPALVDGHWQMKIEDLQYYKQ